jgi:hypothetical protein
MNKCKIDKKLCNIEIQFEIYKFTFYMDSASVVFY